MLAIRDMYGSSVPDPIATVTTDWSLDPLTQGSYSYVPAGGNLADHLILSQPIEDRIFFAGEATVEKHSGTVHGAWLSGLRAAKQIPLAMG